MRPFPAIRRDASSVWAWLGGLACLVVLAASWFQPLLDQHWFRQTQTAMSAYWLTRGGPWLLYHTPIFGPPWSVPFEFPLYQWLLALVAGSPLPLTLDQSGRLLSVAFLLATLWPLRGVLRELGYSVPATNLASALFLLSPLYLFWGRSVMIESLALFLAILFVMCVQRVVQSRGWGWVAAAAFAGSLAALVKVTTFFPAATLAGSIVALAFWHQVRERRYRQALALAVRAAAPVLIALVVLLWWLHAADAVKAISPQTRFGMSDALTRWNYGTWEQRVSEKFWQLLWTRMLPDSAGYLWMVGLLAAFVAGCRAAVMACLGGVALFMLPLMVFTNLHLVHNYYQYANAVYLLAGVAPGLAALGQGWRPWVAQALMMVLVFGMAWRFQDTFWPSVVSDKSAQRPIQIARLIRAQTPEDSIIATHGLSWSPEVPYYSLRRAVMLGRGGGDDLAWILAHPQTQAAGISAFVSCPQRDGTLMNPMPELGAFERFADVGGCRVFLR